MSQPQITVPADLIVNGNLYAKTMQVPSAAIADAQVAGGAGIQATKLQHQYNQTWGQDNAAASAETKGIYAVYGSTATVIAFKVGAITPLTGADTCTVDLRKNGTTILSAVIALANTDTAYQTHAATIASPNLVAGDVLSVVISPTHTSGTLPTGVFAELVVREDPF